MGKYCFVLSCFQRYMWSAYLLRMVSLPHFTDVIMNLTKSTPRGHCHWTSGRRTRYRHGIYLTTIHSHHTLLVLSFYWLLHSMPRYQCLFHTRFDQKRVTDCVVGADMCWRWGSSLCFFWFWPFCLCVMTWPHDDTVKCCPSDSLKPAPAKEGPWVLGSHCLH